MAKLEDIKKAGQRLAFRSAAADVFDLTAPLNAAFQRHGVASPLIPHNPEDMIQH